MKICENRDGNLVKNANFCEFPWKYLQILQISTNICKTSEWSAAKDYQSDRSRQELSNEYLVAKIGFDTAENGPPKVLGRKCGFGSWYMYLQEPL